MTICHLSDEGNAQQYFSGDMSAALPMLSATPLTEMRERMRTEGVLNGLSLDQLLKSQA